MRLTTRTLAATVALVGLIAATPALGPTPAPASGTQPGQAAAYAPSGWLSLETGTNDRVRLDADADGLGEHTQPLLERSNCLLDTDESLLVVNGTVGADGTDVAGFSTNSIGVKAKNTGTSCGLVDATQERLELRLNPAGVRGPFGPLLASSAYLDVELKYGARILATALRGTSPVGYFELRSGASVNTTAPLLGDVTATAIHTCTTSADSGPDSGINDNCRWPISAPPWLPAPDDGIAFDTLKLEAVAGSFSLEGGADGTVAGPLPAPPAPRPAGATLFELVAPVDGTLSCDAVTETEPATGTEPQVTVRRLGNADPAEACVLIPYTLDNGDASARFLKPLDEQGTAQFVFDLVWTVPTSQLPLPTTTVDFESADPRTGIPLGWCPDPLFDDGVLTGIRDPLDDSPDTRSPDLDDALPGKQFACLGSQAAQVVDGEPDVVRVAEQVYVLGDVFLRK